jgi:hypothetical protein
MPPRRGDLWVSGVQATAILFRHRRRVLRGYAGGSRRPSLPRHGTDQDSKPLPTASARICLSSRPVQPGPEKHRSMGTAAQGFGPDLFALPAAGARVRMELFHLPAVRDAARQLPALRGGCRRASSGVDECVHGAKPEYIDPARCRPCHQAVSTHMRRRAWADLSAERPMCRVSAGSFTNYHAALTRLRNTTENRSSSEKHLEIQPCSRNPSTMSSVPATLAYVYPPG